MAHPRPAHTPPIVIRDAGTADLSAAAAIEQLSFPDPWSAEMFRAHLHGTVNLFLVVTDGVHDTAPVLGYIVAHVVAGESELLNIAVHPEWRGRTIGAALLQALSERSHARGAMWMALDVRQSNTPARALYEHHGFVIVGRRRRYYQNPLEDALLMRADLPLQPAPAPPSPTRAEI